MVRDKKRKIRIVRPMVFILPFGETGYRLGGALSSEIGSGIIGGQPRNFRIQAAWRISSLKASTPPALILLMTFDVTSLWA